MLMGRRISRRHERVVWRFARFQSTMAPTRSPTRKKIGEAIKIQMKPSPRSGPERSKKRVRPFVIPPFTVLAFGTTANKIAKTVGIPTNSTAVCSSLPSTIRRYMTLPALTARIRKISFHCERLIDGFGSRSFI